MTGMRRGGAQAVVRALARDAADVVLSRSCAGCGLPGSILCARCAPALQLAPRQRDFEPPLWFGAAYAEPIRSLIVAHKDGGQRALTHELARLLAGAVEAALGHGGLARPVLLVPVPPHRSSLRRRGRDTVAELAITAARDLPGCSNARLLLRVRETSRNAGRGARERSDQAGAFAARTGGTAARPVILVDDVVTTGATLREGIRALEAAGVRVAAIACVASTPLQGR